MRPIFRTAKKKKKDKGKPVFHSLVITIQKKESIKLPLASWHQTHKNSSKKKDLTVACKTRKEKKRKKKKANLEDLQNHNSPARTALVLNYSQILHFPCVSILLPTPSHFPISLLFFVVHKSYYKTKTHVKNKTQKKKEK